MGNSARALGKSVGEAEAIKISDRADLIISRTSNDLIDLIDLMVLINSADRSFQLLRRCWNIPSYGIYRGMEYS